VWLPPFRREPESTSTVATMFIPAQAGPTAPAAEEDPSRRQPTGY